MAASTLCLHWALEPEAYQAAPVPRSRDTTGTELGLGTGDGHTRSPHADADEPGRGAERWSAQGRGRAQPRLRLPAGEAQGARPTGRGGAAASDDALVRVHGDQLQGAQQHPSQKPAQNRDGHGWAERQAAVARAPARSQQNSVEFEGPLARD